MSAKIYTFTPTASAGKVNDLGSRVAVLENENPVKSVNAVEPDENGNVNISTVDYAYGIASDDAQSSDGTFICRTTGGSSSLSDGSAWLATIRGHSVHTGYVTESLDMTVNQAEREQSEEHTDVGISATIDRDTFVDYVTSSGTVTLTHNGTAWSADPTLYGITVIGTPIANDKIVVVYVKEDRGTISNATPTAFVSTGWNIYDYSKKYARAVKYDNNAVFGISGAYSALQFSSTISGTKTNITVSNGRFTVPGDGYIWVTGGNSTTTAIWMTWSDWTDGHEGGWRFYTESIVNIASLSASGHIFENGMCSIGGVADTIDFDLGTATSNIERMAYTAQNLETVIASGRTYDCDRNYIYVVRETPVTESFSINKEYTANDHGLEFFVGTEVECYASMLYGSNLVEYLKHDVPEQISNLSTDVSTLRKGLAIAADGNTHARIEFGQFVDVRNHSSLADGLYSAKNAIEVNGSLSTSNLKAESSGGLNALNSRFQTRVNSLSDFISMFDGVRAPRLVFVMTNATNALTGGRTNGDAVVVGYKTYDSSYIIYYGQSSQPYFFSGYIDLSNNNITVHEMYSMRRVRCNFNGITITAGGYKKLCGYSAIRNGISGDNIVSVKVQAGTFSGTQMVEVYQDGLYLYSSSAYTNKNIVLDIIYTPYATILYDDGKTITVT